MTAVIMSLAHREISPTNQSFRFSYRSVPRFLSYEDPKLGSSRRKGIWLTSYCHLPYATAMVYNS